ncbi:MAG: UDP-N-acetylglucosamine 1-carboxyvinyltransferase, partial [Prolixibacteraceae bacterium]|nr:UDP-N-acetylglucosamine 1-carboxyvinyltransferase [Prolixibacteraceae bacterium]
MATFHIEGGHRLSGTLEPQGAKNEALQVICATLLTDQDVTITNITEIIDVMKLTELLKGMGVSIIRHGKGNYTFN